MGRLRYLTAGESHGRALVGILEGMPAGLPLSLGAINEQLARRQRGFGRGGRQLIERDQAEVLSGVRFGRTLGSPIAVLIWNRDWENWRERMDPWREPPDYRPVTVPRPGHADLAGAIKYQHRDVRNVLERASARETAVRVALGAIARQLLSHFGIEIASHVVQIHTIQSPVSALDFEDAKALNARADASPVRCPDPEASERMVAKIQEAMQKRDSVGGVFELVLSSDAGAGLGRDRGRDLDGGAPHDPGGHEAALDAAEAPRLRGHRDERPRPGRSAAGEAGRRFFRRAGGPLAALPASALSDQAITKCTTSPS